MIQAFVLVSLVYKIGETFFILLYTFHYIQCIDS
jgi:hypothetical protein